MSGIAHSSNTVHAYVAPVTITEDELHTMLNHCVGNAGKKASSCAAFDVFVGLLVRDLLKLWAGVLAIDLSGRASCISCESLMFVDYK